MGIRLPSWDQHGYYWGAKVGPDASLAKDYEWNGKDSDGHPHPVGEKRPNPWGLFDMAGNVPEGARTGSIPMPTRPRRHATQPDHPPARNV